MTLYELIETELKRAYYSGVQDCAYLCCAKHPEDIVDEFKDLRKIEKHRFELESAIQRIIRHK